MSVPPATPHLVAPQTTRDRRGPCRVVCASTVAVASLGQWQRRTADGNVPDEIKDLRIRCPKGSFWGYGTPRVTRGWCLVDASLVVLRVGREDPFDLKMQPKEPDLCSLCTSTYEDDAPTGPDTPQIGMGRRWASYSRHGAVYVCVDTRDRNGSRGPLCPVVVETFSWRLDFSGVPAPWPGVSHHGSPSTPRSPAPRRRFLESRFSVHTPAPTPRRRSLESTLLSFDMVVWENRDTSRIETSTVFLGVSLRLDKDLRIPSGPRTLLPVDGRGKVVQLSEPGGNGVTGLSFLPR